MFRLSVFLLAAALVPCSAGAESRRPLDEQLTEYVESFDLAGLAPPVLDRLAYVASHPEASHVAKVIEIHDILKKNDALRHVDMHGAAPSMQARLRQ